MSWQFHTLGLTNAQLAHARLSPSVKRSVFNDGQGVERPGCDVIDVEDAVLVVEELDKRWRCCNFNCFREAELALEATTPSVKVALIGHDHRVSLAASDHCDALISQWLQNLRFLGRSRASMACNALVSRSHAEYVTVTRQVQRMILSAGNGEEPTNVFMLLCA